LTLAHASEAGHVPASGDVRDLLRLDHEAVLAEIDALRTAAANEAQDPMARLQALRRRWVIHALAEETVVYKALEGLPVAGPAQARADERFIEHELVDELFEKLERVKPSTSEWTARLNVARALIARHIETEHEEMFQQLESRFDADGLTELGRRFELAHDKLALLEEAKAA
jgi:hemerythrin-like domain-containing protein